MSWFVLAKTRDFPRFFRFWEQISLMNPRISADVVQGGRRRLAEGRKSSWDLGEIAMVSIDEILRHALDRDASDIHLKCGSPPSLRRYGHLACESSMASLSQSDLQDIVAQLADEGQRARLEAERQVDLGYGTDDLGRFRVNVYHQRGELRIAMRVIPRTVRSPTELQLPEIRKT